METRKRTAQTPSVDEQSATRQDDQEKRKLGMKRKVGLISSTAIIVGSMIGSGIFISPKGVLRQTNSVGMSLVIWLLCGVLSTISALCYAELGTMIPKSGGNYSYLYDIYGPTVAFFLSWVSVLLAVPASVALVSLIFAEYVAAPFFSGGDCGPPDTVIKLLAIACIVVAIFVNCASVTWTAYVQNIFTAAKVLALVIIIVVGVVKLISDPSSSEYLNPAVSFKGSTTNIAAYGIAFYQGLWAYDGWNQLNNLTEEIINPYKNLPLAIVISIPLVTILYLLVNISYLTVMSPDELLQSSAVAVTFADRTLGVVAWCIPVFVACSTYGAVNGSFFTSGRIAYVAGRNGHMPKLLSMIHVDRLTPMASVLFKGLISILMVLPGDFDTLVNYFSFTSWTFYGLTVSGLLYMRYKMPDAHRPIKVPIVLPIIVVIASCYLVIAPIVEYPAIEFLYAFLGILSGGLFYVPFVYYKLNFPGMSYFTSFFQQFLEVAPGKYVAPEEDIKEGSYDVTKNKKSEFSGEEETQTGIK